MTEEQKNQFLKECADDGWQILQDMADAIHGTPSGIMPEDKWPIIINNNNDNQGTDGTATVDADTED